MSNVLFINGWGGALTSFSIANLRNRTIKEFGDQIYAPPPVDYTDESSLMRYVDKWKDIQILVELSCGVSAGLKIAGLRPSEVIPYMACYSPSRLCGVLRFPVPKNVAKATQITSNPWDGFNLGGLMCLKPAKGNNVTQIDEIKSGYPHGWSCDHPGAQARLWSEIRATLKGDVNPQRVGK